VGFHVLAGVHELVVEVVCKLVAVVDPTFVLFFGFGFRECQILFEFVHFIQVEHRLDLVFTFLTFVSPDVVF